MIMYILIYSLNLEFNKENTVNDEALYNLSFCKNLEDLNVNYCYALTDIFLMNLDGIMKIKTFCIAGIIYKNHRKQKFYKRIFNLIFIINIKYIGYIRSKLY